MFVSSPNSFIESNSQSDSIGKWGLSGGWGVEGRALTSGIRACKKRLENLLTLFPASEDTTGSQESTTGKNIFLRMWPCWHPDLRLPTSRTARNNCLFFISCTVVVLCYRGLNYCSQSQSHTSLQKRQGDAGRLEVQTEKRKQIGEHIIFLLVLNIYFSHTRTYSPPKGDNSKLHAHSIHSIPGSQVMVETTPPRAQRPIIIQWPRKDNLSANSHSTY